MSRHRINPKAGWATPTGRCRYCTAELPPNRTFCSEKDRDCVHQWKIRSNPGYVRQCLKRRDHEVCGSCGLDCRALQDAITEFVYGSPRTPVRPGATGRQDSIDRYRETAARKLWLRDVGLSLDKSPWEAHHIDPVVRGGGECGLEGYVTLCRWCHARGTKVLAEIRKYERKVARWYHDTPREDPSSGKSPCCSPTPSPRST